MATLARTLHAYRTQRAAHISAAREYLHKAATDRRHDWRWLMAHHYAKAQQHRRWARAMNDHIEHISKVIAGPPQA